MKKRDRERRLILLHWVIMLFEIRVKTIFKTTVVYKYIPQFKGKTHSNTGVKSIFLINHNFSLVPTSKIETHSHGQKIKRRASTKLPPSAQCWEDRQQSGASA